MTVRAPASEVHYPESDGRPMAESDAHRDEMKDYVIDVLRAAFAADPLVYVSGNNFIYYDEGDRAECVSPDAYVVKGVSSRRRKVYKVWEEGGQAPCFVLEVTSQSTRREDLGDKMTKYRDDLQVAEYFLFDLGAEWIPERLRGYRLHHGVYQPIRPRRGGRLPSRTLGLELGPQGGHVRFFVPGEATPIPTEEERAERERERAERERERAEHERERAERERERAERERERAEHAEDEIRQLRDEVARLRGE